MRVQEDQGRRWIDAGDAIIWLEDDAPKLKSKQAPLTTERIAYLRRIKPKLIALLAGERPDPRSHFLSLADGWEAVGITGRLGAHATGELWQAMQAWEKTPTPDLERAYWAAWERFSDIGASA